MASGFAATYLARMDTAFEHRVRAVPIWKKAPFIRLIIPLMSGIILQWYVPSPLRRLMMIAGVLVAAWLIVMLVKRFRRRRRQELFDVVFDGLLLNGFIALIGAVLCYHHDARNDPHWLGSRLDVKNEWRPADRLLVKVCEPPVESERTWKLVCQARYLLRGTQRLPVSGGLLIYLRKTEKLQESIPLRGERVLLEKQPSPLKPTGNPAAFDYARYALFQGITHQVFLGADEYHCLPRVQSRAIADWLESARQRVIRIMQQFVPGEREAGMAEALLIGYRGDLDRNLVDVYANTGVVHIIAISGMHLALIYWLLELFLRPFTRKRKLRWISPAGIIIGLWLFSLLAGAQPSIIRSAVMFTCIVIGRSLGRKVPICQSLALSAFLLLCYNPYWLWDLGFQLSYTAVLSLVVFMKPIYDLLYFRNPLIDLAWQSVAVSLAAQILTLPLSVFHFHQLPNYFWASNFFAVPLSTGILFAELLLCACCWMPFIAGLVGKLTSWMIALMNRLVEHISSLPYAVWDQLEIGVLQCVLLYLFAWYLYGWLVDKDRRALKPALLIALVFFVLRSVNFVEAGVRKRIIVYQVSNHTAVDLVNGSAYRFIGEPDLLEPALARYHGRPSRSSMRVSQIPSEVMDPHRNRAVLLNGKRVLFLVDEEALQMNALPRSTPSPLPLLADLLILSGRNHTDLGGLLTRFRIGVIVIDPSVPVKRAMEYLQQPRDAGLPCHDVRSMGAFIVDIK